jgi:WG containing repeat
MNMNSKKLLFTVSILFCLPLFAQQIDASLIPYRQGDLWGYASPDKKIIIKPAYNEAHWFVGGLAVVKKGSKYGYINKAGTVAIPIKFYSAKPFRFGYFDKAETHKAGGKVVQNQDTVLFAGATLTMNGVESCIDTRGRVMSKCPAINENSVPDNNKIVSVTEEKIYSLVNNANLYDKIVDDYKIVGDENTYYIGVKNNQYGLINNKFEVIAPFEYSTLKKLSIGDAVYLQGVKNGMYGMLKGDGSVYIPAENSNMVYVKGRNGSDYFIVSKDGRSMVKDIAYKDIVPANYTEVLYDDEGGFVLTGNDNRKGFYFLDNKIIEPRYTDVKLIRGGKYLMVKTQTGKIGYVSTDGIEYFDQ